MNDGLLELSFVMLREGGASSIHRDGGDYWIVRLRGR
jgi:hypothetical protein